MVPKSSAEPNTAQGKIGDTAERESDRRSGEGDERENRASVPHHACTTPPRSDSCRSFYMQSIHQRVPQATSLAQARSRATLGSRLSPGV